MKKIFTTALIALAMTACGGNGNNENNETTTPDSVPATENTEAVPAEDGAPQAEDAAAATAPTGVQVLGDDNQFRPDKKVDVVTVLDFNATWCGPCKKLTPAYEAAAKDYAGKVAFYSVDFEKLPQTAAAFKITSVPTVYVLTPNGEAQRFEGLGPFTEGLKDDATAEEFNKVVTSNLKTIIDKAIGQ